MVCVWASHVALPWNIDFYKLRPTTPLKAVEMFGYKVTLRVVFASVEAREQNKLIEQRDAKELHAVVARL